MTASKRAGMLAALVLLRPTPAQAAEPPKGPKGWGVFLRLQFAAGGKKVDFTVKAVESKDEQTVYLAKGEKFIKAMAARFDGESRVEYFEIGIGQGGSTGVTAVA